MKRIIFLTLSVLALALHSLSAQTTEGTDSYRYHKATEILDNRGDPQEARKLLNENIEEFPGHIHSYLVLISMDRRDGDYSSALRLIEKALKNNHKKSGVVDNTLHWWRASIYEDMGELSRAIQMLEEVAKEARKQKDENLQSMLENLAQLYYLEERYDEADKIYNEMIALDETHQLPIVGLARNMYKREKYQEALTLLDQCSKLDKDYYEIHRYKMLVYEGMEDYKKMIDAMMTLYDITEDSDYLSINRFKKNKKYSIALIKEKIADDKNSGFWRAVLATLYEECHDYVQAIQILDSLMDEYGYDEDLLEQRSDCYDELGMTQMALEDINKVLEMTDQKNHPYYYCTRSGIYRYAGMYEEAIEDVDKYIDRYPTDAFGYYARGWCKELSGDLTGAMEDYNDGIDVDESFPYIYLMRGTLHLKNGDSQKAMADFETVIAKDTTLRRGSCRHYALHFLGKSEEAEQWMNQLIEKDPDDPGKWYDKACLYARMGRCDEAMEVLKTAFEKGYRAFPHIEHDDDVDPLRNREDFKCLFAQYKEILETEIEKLEKKAEDEAEKVVSEIDMRKMYGGTYEIPCSVNGLPLRMIFDTGAADVTISSVEASFMLKNGYLSDNDVKGKQHYMTASGDIHEGTVLKLKEVRLGDAVLKNIEASVVHSQKAPLLLGQIVSCVICCFCNIVDRCFTFFR